MAQLVFSFGLHSYVCDGASIKYFVAGVDFYTYLAGRCACTTSCYRPYANLSEQAFNWSYCLLFYKVIQPCLIAFVNYRARRLCCVTMAAPTKTLPSVHSDFIALISKGGSRQQASPSNCIFLFVSQSTKWHDYQFLPLFIYKQDKSSGFPCQELMML